MTEPKPKLSLGSLFDIISDIKRKLRLLQSTIPVIDGGKSGTIALTANTTFTQTYNFNVNFDNIPVVSPTIYSGASTTVLIKVNNITTTSFDIVLRSSSTENLTFGWLAYDPTL